MLPREIYEWTAVPVLGTGMFDMQHMKRALSDGLEFCGFVVWFTCELHVICTPGTHEVSGDAAISVAHSTA